MRVILFISFISSLLLLSAEGFNNFSELFGLVVHLLVQFLKARIEMSVCDLELFNLYLLILHHFINVFLTFNKRLDSHVGVDIIFINFIHVLDQVEVCWRTRFSSIEFESSNFMKQISLHSTIGLFRSL